MTINNLITNISNALEVPSKIKYNNEIFEYNNDLIDEINNLKKEK